MAKQMAKQLQFKFIPQERHAHVKERLGDVVGHFLSRGARKMLRIQSTSEEPRAKWIERYFLADARGRYRERKDIPGNGQYAPGNGEILAWFRRLGVTHIEVAKGWWTDARNRDAAGTYDLKAFGRLLRRASRDAES